MGTQVRAEAGHPPLSQFPGHHPDRDLALAGCCRVLHINGSAGMKLGQKELCQGCSPS